MRKRFFKILLIFLICFQSTVFIGQEPQTIRVKKESNLVKAVFDNTESKLIVVDRFGNPRENKIASYKFYVKTNKETKEFSGYGNSLSNEMSSYLNKLEKAAKIFFTEIVAKDDNEHLVPLPDVIETWFPDCVNCKNYKNKKR